MGVTRDQDGIELFCQGYSKCCLPDTGFSEKDEAWWDCSEYSEINVLIVITILVVERKAIGVEMRVGVDVPLDEELRLVLNHISSDGLTRTQPVWVILLLIKVLYMVFTSIIFYFIFWCVFIQVVILRWEYQFISGLVPLYSLFLEQYLYVRSYETQF